MIDSHTKVLLTLLVIVVFLGGGYLLWQQKSQFVTGESATMLPDFRATKMEFPSDAAAVLVTIENSGGPVTPGAVLHVTAYGTTLSQNASGEYESELFEAPLFDGDIVPPEAGEVSTYTLDIPQSAFEVGIHDITIVLNGDNTIEESDDVNNTYTEIPIVIVEPHEGE